MQKSLSIKRIFLAFLAITVVLAMLTMLSLMRVSSKEAEAKKAADSRYQSYLLADELRQSSDDLTRLARTYVVTGDAAYEQQYMDILAIRNGQKPRPQHYERIYWDFVAAGAPVPPSSGQAIALSELMKRAGFTGQEFAKLKEAEANSNELVRTEVIAMNAVKGKFDDGKGGFTKEGPPDPEMARNIMHDKAYHQNKAKIMQPVNEFLSLLDERTSAEVAAASSAFDKAQLLAQLLQALSVVAAVGCLLFAYRYIRFGLQQAIDTAECIAGGDLSRDIDTSRSDEIGQLLQAMEHINKGLADMIGNIRGSTDQMTVATTEIATGNADLSSRTESQASSLEETASAMENLTDTVQQNAGNAQQANQLAADAAHVAEQGGDVVAQVVTTMGAIKDSSARINDIIGVIDGIAFQTNILALNAAVEAARAGEQGRGFAVVASEVRNLAQRSAAAAKEIKELIGASVARVEEGGRLVDAAGDTMQRIVASVHKVAGIMGEITSASAQQSSGIGEVNQAIGQMDAMTQQNAALVEQAAAAAESLQEQAQALAKAVSIFRLKGGAGAAQNTPAAVARPVVAAASARPVRAVPALRPARTPPPAQAARPAPASSARSPRPAAGDDWEEF
ncbi:methyl-accepting chemotaxis protein [Pseudoduganella eburnea]|uniref:Methyl-accepting chemotaxis protein n=1 Tax=Massilia eburnea TaxID=1776165 RepID=A0A6L6QGN1_9BURK|nr:methyl-accepting chemotaxis protein [Massilia eburnea]MTW10846.1 methyl-accepting chemotaxis protein [Massilia eburnea]